YEEDIWTEIAKYLDGISLVMLATTSKWFHRVIMDECVWKYACLRDLQVPAPRHISFKWIKLYASAFDGSHSFMFRQREKHIGIIFLPTYMLSSICPLIKLGHNWMRIGAFFIDSSAAFLMEKLSPPSKILPETIGSMLQETGSCVLNNVKAGIWIADLQLVRCPVCDLNTCDGTMQMIDARHIELFLSEGYKNGKWEYELIGTHEVRKKAKSASGGILDFNYLKDPSSKELFDLKTWVGKPDDWQPKAMITLHAVAVNTNLQENEGKIPVLDFLKSFNTLVHSDFFGLHVKFHTMRAGDDGQVVSIRISQQLL
ncbi:hypothetical protein RJ641_016643, partial [Dillenia turbinata]